MTTIEDYQTIPIENLQAEYNNNIKILNNISLNNLSNNDDPMNSNDKLYIFRNQYQLELVRIANIINTINTTIPNTQ